MKLEPYIFFYGHCEEALEFYKGVFGGTYQLQRVEGTPMAENLPPEARNAVMHAKFDGPGFTFLASDGPGPSKQLDAESGNVSLSITASSEAEGRQIFDALAEGGNVQMPFGDAFWGGKFGVLTDKFATEWLISSD